VVGLTRQEDFRDLNSTVNENASETDEIGGSASILYQHRFEKEGRTISASLSLGLDDGDGYSRLISEDVFFTEEDEDTFTRQRTSRDSFGRTTGLRLAFTEQLGENHQVELSYSPSRGLNSSDRIARAWDDLVEEYVYIEPALSNQYDNLNITHRAGVNYRKRGEATSVRIGLEYEDYRLSGDQTYPHVYEVDQHFTSVVPNARIEHEFSDNASLRLDYRVRTRTPSVSQLQSVIDNSNPISLSTGNQDLKQSTSHDVNLRIRRTNPDAGRTLSGSVSFSATRNHIGRETIFAEEDTDLGDGIILRTGSRLTRPVNMSGLWQVRGSGTYSFPFDLIKSNLHLDADYGFSRAPGFINGVENISRRHNVGSELSIRSNVSERIDFDIEYGASYSFVENTVRSGRDDNYLRHQFGIDFEVHPWESLELNSDFSLSRYSRSEDLDSETMRWDASIAYSFL
jgi:hypothetical protein